MKSFDDRKFVVLGVFLLIGIIYILRLFYIQVINDSFKTSAENQALQYLTQHAARGLIYDRNGELLVYNQAAYDLMVIPRQIKNLDTAAFCNIVDITRDEFDTKLKKAKKYSRYKASAFEKQISAENYASIAEKLYLFKGFFGQKRTHRKYSSNVAAHVLGYISEADRETLKSDPYYKRGDYVGSGGLEFAYEKELRGKRGVKILMKDVHSRVKGSYKNGQYDTLSVPGTTLTATLDNRIQLYGEQLMRNKKGSIVAIEPATGEILALVSSPSYDPNLLIGRNRTSNYLALVNNDSLNPLFNRALMAKYSPGSIFKIVQALIEMQEGAIYANSGFPCNKNLVGCHNHEHCKNITKAIQFSCNPYFYLAFKKLIQSGKHKSIFKDSEAGLGVWEKHVRSFGLGQTLPIDLTGMKSGTIPGPSYYDQLYGKHRWAFSTIYSISIGQGEVELVPLQMANLACIIANRGYYYTPHLIKSVGENGQKRDEFLIKNITTVSPKHFGVVIDAMQAVIEAPGGTARRARIDNITVCGKTGTVENIHGEDHSVFMAFAPKENPKIAIAVYVENAGFGGSWAAPISSLIIEKYLTDSISNPEKELRILERDFINNPAAE